MKVIVDKQKEYNRRWKERNKEHIKLYDKIHCRIYYAQNKEVVKQRNKMWLERHPNHIKEYNKRGYVREYYKKYLAKWYRENKEKCKKYHDKRMREHGEEVKVKDREYVIQNREKLLIHRKDRYKNDILFRLSVVIRNRTCYVFKRLGVNKPCKTIKILGADYQVVKDHIEVQFQEGMGWENYGKWHIDHKIPLSSAINLEELMKLCYYKNLQPLWEIDNIRKGNRIDNCLGNLVEK